MAERRRSSKSSVEDFVIDFSKEEQGGGGGIRVKPGQYLVKVKTAKAITSEEKGTPGLELMLTILEGKYKGKTLRERVWATPKAYSRFRTLLEAIGKKAPKRLELGRIAEVVKGEELVVEVDDEEREGYKARSRVTFDGFISVEDADDEDDTDEEDDDLDEDDEIEEEDEEPEDEDDEEEEDEPEPPKRRRRSKPAPAKKRRRRPADEDEDDDLDLDEL